MKGPKSSPPLAAFAVSLAALGSAVVLLSGQRLDLLLPWKGPLGPVRIVGDSLSGAYLLLVGLVGVAAAAAGAREPANRTGRALVVFFLAGILEGARILSERRSRAGNGTQKL